MSNHIPTTPSYNYIFLPSYPVLPCPTPSYLTPPFFPSSTPSLSSLPPSLSTFSLLQSLVNNLEAKISEVNRTTQDLRTAEDKPFPTIAYYNVSVFSSCERVVLESCDLSENHNCTTNYTNINTLEEVSGLEVL